MMPTAKTHPSQTVPRWPAGTGVDEATGAGGGRFMSRDAIFRAKQVLKENAAEREDISGETSPLMSGATSEYAESIRLAVIERADLFSASAARIDSAIEANHATRSRLLDDAGMRWANIAGTPAEAIWHETQESLNELYENRSVMAKKYFDDVLELLRAPNPATIPVSYDEYFFVDGEVESHHEIQQEDFRDIWGRLTSIIDASIIESRVTVEYRVREGHGGEFSPTDNAIAIGDDSREADVWHEMGHWLEHNNPTLRSQVHEFLEERTAGDVIERISYGDDSYEMGSYESTPDDFINPYMGRYYQGVVNGRLERQGTEIVSMGLDYLRRGPEALAKGDPEYFNNLIMWLHGMGNTSKSIAYKRVAERDISHVWRDERGRWTDTPGVGDDAVPEEHPEEVPEESPEEQLEPTAEDYEAYDAIIDAENRPRETPLPDPAADDRHPDDYDFFGMFAPEDGTKVPQYKNIDTLDIREPQARLLEEWGVDIGSELNGMLEGIDQMGMQANIIVAEDTIDDREDLVEINMYFRENVYGRLVGNATMRLGEGVAKLDSAMFAKQQIGIASTMMPRMIDFLKRTGATKIGMLADSTIGKYAWAKNGFDFASPLKHKRARFLLRGWAEEKGIVVTDEQLNGLNTARDFAEFDTGHVVYSNEIHNFDVPVGMAMHVGKAFMLDDDGLGNWEAVISAEALGADWQKQETQKAAATPQSPRGVFLLFGEVDTTDPRYEGVTDGYFWADWLRMDAGENEDYSQKAQRDISHVLRDERGRWTDTPGVGDDEPKKQTEAERQRDLDSQIKPDIESADFADLIRQDLNDRQKFEPELAEYFMDTWHGAPRGRKEELYSRFFEEAMGPLHVPAMELVIEEIGPEHPLSEFTRTFDVSFEPVTKLEGPIGVTPQDVIRELPKDAPFDNMDDYRRCAEQYWGEYYSKSKEGSPFDWRGISNRVNGPRDDQRGVLGMPQEGDPYSWEGNADGDYEPSKWLTKEQAEWLRRVPTEAYEKRKGEIRQKLGFTNNLNDPESVLRQFGITEIVDPYHIRDDKEAYRDLYRRAEQASVNLLDRIDVSQYSKSEIEDVLYDYVRVTAEKAGVTYLQDMPEHSRERAIGSLFLNVAMASAKDEYNFRVRSGVALGQIDVDLAENLTYYAKAQGVGGWQDLPTELWHTTTNVDAIISDRLRSRVELGQRDGLGLGGGENDTISFTTDPEIGKQIERALHEAWYVGNGMLTTKDMLSIAAAGGGGAERPYIKDAVAYIAGTSIKEELPEDFDIDNPEHRAMLPMRVQQMINVDDGIEEPPEPEWDYEPSKEDWAIENAWSTFRAISTAREQNGGFFDPLFFSSDWKGLAKANPEQFQTLKLRARPGAKGYVMGSMAEWRTVGGNTVAVEEAINHYDYKRREDFERIVGVRE